MRKTAIPRRLPKPKSADSAEREYWRLLRPYTERYIAILKEALARTLPSLQAQAEAVRPAVPTMDSTSQRRYDSNLERGLRLLLERVGKQLSTEYPDTTLARWGWVMVDRVKRTANTNIETVGKSVGLEVEPLLRDQELTPLFRQVVEVNVGLIKSIPQGRMVALKNQLVAAIAGDASQDVIRQLIQKHFDATRSQARLIARDQTNKLNGTVTQYRQQQLGGERYTWRTARDGRERPDHKRLEGEVFRWTQPPITNRATGARNHPGQDFQCRCWAEMVLEDVVS